MKKSLILVGMLAIGYANAQEGVVGINTSEPKATLQVTPSAENAKADATTNEGIMAPQLSKSRVAGIATPVEGTLVYVTDETTSPITAYKGTDTKVAKITEKGYYFYNGTEWVKTSATDGGEWAHNGTDAIYAKRAKDATKSNIFEILDNGRTYTNQGNLDWTTFLDYQNRPTLKANPRGLTPNLTLQSSDILPLVNNNYNYETGNTSYSFNTTTARINKEHLDNSETGNAKYYVGSNFSLSTEASSSIKANLQGANTSAALSTKASGHYGIVRGLYGGATNGSAATAEYITGIWGDASASRGNGLSKNLTGVYGAGFMQHNAQAETIRGGDFQALVRWTDKSKSVKHLIGISAQAVNENTGGAPITDVMMAGQFNTLAEEATTYEKIKGIQVGTSLSENVEVTNDVRGIEASTHLNGKTEIADVRSIYSATSLNNAKVKNLVGIQSDLMIDPAGIGTVTDYAAFKTDVTQHTFNGSITNFYDFHGIGQVVSPNTKNYGVYIDGDYKTNFFKGKVGIGTNTPTVKLEVNGEIKSSVLANVGAGDRVVYADENGVLKTGGSIAANNGVQTQSGMTCTAENAGKINYTTIQKDGKDVGVFGFCMQKGTDYVWAYMLGGSNIYGTSANGAAFGDGL